jgi:DNA repair exonuclease SbcCD ATPase subunit
MCVIERDGKVVIIDQTAEIERLRGFETAARDLNNDLIRIAGERDELAARIQELEDALAEAERLICKNADMINAQTATVAALKEIAVEEGAYRAYYEANARTESYADFGYSLVANGLFSAARDRLTKEHPEAFR